MTVLHQAITPRSRYAEHPHIATHIHHQQAVRCQAALWSPIGPPMTKKVIITSTTMDDEAIKGYPHVIEQPAGSCEGGTHHFLHNNHKKKQYASHRIT